MKLGATGNPAGTALADGFVHDNTTPNRYYVGLSTTFGGTGAAVSKYNHLITIRMKVNRREPGDYTQNTPVTPPRKTAGSAGTSNPPPVVTPPPVPAEPLEVAPPPTEKAAGEE